MNYAKTGAVFFILWGVLHIIGGGAILAALSDSPEAGFAIYQESAASYTELAGGVLGYLAFTFVWIAAAVTYVAIRYNWRNSQDGLMLNTALVGFTDLGLIIFLVLPGFLGWADAAPGLLLFIGGAVFGGIACQSSHAPEKAAA